MRVGIDLEQFCVDPYGSGIQRVLQYMALTWPQGEIEPVFIAPMPDSSRSEFIALNSQQASDLLSVPFAPPATQHPSDRNLVGEIAAKLLSFNAPVLTLSQVLATCHVWFLPEVTYLDQVLERFALMAQAMPTLMIGYDTFPMTEPSNYRFRPGMAAQVNGYFHHLTNADSVVCISEFARQSLWGQLRRDRSLPCTVAHPGGDHVPSSSAPALSAPVRFIRLGTLEARKHPVEIVDAFVAAIDSGISAELLFIGRPSASDSSINDRLYVAIDSDYPITWIESASDAEVQQLVAESDVFLSVGHEGYGIPVLEAIQLSTPVLYWGVQPAAVLIQGHGSREIGTESGSLHDVLVSAFSTYSERSTVSEFRDEISSQVVPQWEDFSREIAQAAKKLLSS